MPLSQVLDSIARRGHFEFSYNSSIVPGDSLVTLVFRQVTVRAALDQLLGPGYVYAEQGKYLIILRSAPAQAMTERTYLLTGYIIDDSTGQGVGDASVYVKEQLQSTLTDQQGYFRLRLRVRSALPVLSVSKAWYMDTDIIIHAGYDQVLSIPIVHVSGKSLSPVFVTSAGVERSWWGRRFLTYRQRVQSLNLAHFFTSSSAQVSLVPWVGTHGSIAQTGSRMARALRFIRASPIPMSRSLKSTRERNPLECASSSCRSWVSLSRQPSAMSPWCGRSTMAMRSLFAARRSCRRTRSKTISDGADTRSMSS